jgi:LuxR family transcriptional regulator, regulator of acetate metabolism
MMLTAAHHPPAIAAPLDLVEVLTRLSELGPPSEIRGRAATEAAAAADLDRVLLTTIERRTLLPEALHLPAGTGDAAALLATLREDPVALEYPLIEGEIMRRRRPQVVRLTPGQPSGRAAFADRLGWTDYVAAPISIDGRVIGFLHGDREMSRRSVDDADAAALGAFALCFALVFERAVLRYRLRDQRHEMRQVASWADARTSELGERSISLSEDRDTGEADITVRRARPGDSALRDLLTRRELDVLELMVRGETNAGIARDLVLSEGTVKFHVKNILRKLHATNRAEATSRYLRLTLNRERGTAR